MVKGIPRMNYLRAMRCPTGYIWTDNVTYPSVIALMEMGKGNCIFSLILQKRREIYGDVQVVTPAFDNRGNELKDSVALYVPHPAVRRVYKLLRRLKK